MSSLIPSRQFVFSPGLAATIGLEEAILLQCLSDESEELSGEKQSSFLWYELKKDWLLSHLPFWSLQDISRVSENLRQQGIILVASPPLTECGHIRFAFNEQAAGGNQAATPQHQVSPNNHSPSSYSPNDYSPDNSQAHNQHARPIAKNWAPDNDCLKLLAQQGVPANFARDTVPEFVQYWGERGEARHAWGNRFVTHALRRWRDYETRQSREQKEADIPSWAASTAQSHQARPMHRDWKPSTDAMEILEIQAGIHRNFVEDAIPEFVLYWSEKGEHSNTWNARFINHVKRQWAGFQHATKNDLEPRPIDPSWQPSADVYDVLRFARIELEFAQQLLPEFVIYWRDRNEARPSWNTIFLQFVKNQWARQNQQNNDNENKAIKETSFRDRLTDRSWA